MKTKGVLKFICVGLAVQLALPRFLLAEPFRAGPSDELRVSIRLRGGLDDLGKIPVNSSLTVVGDEIYSQHDVRVGPDGTISLPTISSLRVEGLTLAEIERAVGAFCCAREPSGAVSISLLYPHHSAFFVSGEVAKPGRFVMERPTSIVEAVTLAGGPTWRAHLKKVQVLRTGSPILSVDLSLLRLEAKPEQNAEAIQFDLRANDTVVVPRKRGVDQPTLMIFLTVISVITGVYIAAKLN